MKLHIVHFTRQIPICGAFSPKSLCMSAAGDKHFVTQMEMDWEKRCVWLTVGGNRAPSELRGRRLPVSLEHVVLSVPADEAVTAPAVVPEKKSGARA